MRGKLDGLSVAARTIKIQPLLDAGALRTLRADLLARLEANPVLLPVKPVVNTGVLRTLRAELEANPVSVPIRPVLDAAALRILRSELTAVHVPVVPQLDPVALRSLRTQIEANPLPPVPLRIQPLDVGVLNTLRAELASPIQVAVRAVLDAEALRALRATARAQLEAEPIFVPVRVQVDAAALRTMRADVLAQLEASPLPPIPLRVEPRLDADVLRAVRARVEAIPPVPVTISPVLDPSVLRTLRARFDETPFPVTVTPVLDIAVLDALRADVVARLEAKPIPIFVTAQLSASALRVLRADVLARIKANPFPPVPLTVEPQLDIVALRALSRVEIPPATILVKPLLNTAALSAITQTEIPPAILRIQPVIDVATLNKLVSRVKVAPVPLKIAPVLSFAALRTLLDQAKSRVVEIPLKIDPRLNLTALRAALAQAKSPPVPLEIMPVLNPEAMRQVIEVGVESHVATLRINPALDANGLRKLKALAEKIVLPLKLTPVLDIDALRLLARVELAPLSLKIVPKLDAAAVRKLRTQVKMAPVPLTIEPVFDVEALRTLTKVNLPPIVVEVNAALNAASFRTMRADLRARVEAISTQQVPLKAVLDTGALRALRIELRARLEENPISVPVTVVLDSGAVAALRTEILAQVEAARIPPIPVLLSPQPLGAAALRALTAELQTQLEASPATIPVRAVLDAAALRALRANLRARLTNAIPVPVTPVLVLGAIRTMRADLRTRLAANPVPIPVTPVLAPGAVRQLRAQIVAAGVTVPVRLAPTGPKAAAIAGGATDRGAAASRAAATSLNQKLLQASTQTAREAQRATREALEEELGSLRQLNAARTKAVADARAGALTGTTVRKQAADLGKAAAGELTRAENLLAKARESGTKKIQESAASQVRQARANVEGAGVAERTAVAFKALTATEERLTVVQDQGKLATEQSRLRLLSKAEASKLAKASAQTLIAAEKALAAATEGGNAAQIQSAENLVSLAGVARTAASAISHIVVAQEAELKQTNAMIIGTNERRIMQDKLTIAIRVDTEAQLAYNAALASGDDALVVYTAQMAKFAAARAAEATATVQAADRQRALIAAQRPLLNSIERINAGIARNEAALGSQRAVSNAINLEAQAVALHARSAAAAAANKVGPALVAEAESARVAATEFRNLAQAEFASAQAATQGDRTRSAATRGVVATTASFLGLRGAVLSSTIPFLAATIAVTAFGKVLATSGETQQALIQFQAVTSATADQMKAAADEARKLGADVKLPATSSVDAANAMTELAKAGLSIKDSLAAARGSLQLAAAAGISAGDAAQIAASQLNAFGLAGDQAGRVTDLLAAASIDAQGSINDFALAFRQSATVASQAGLSINQTTALLTQLARAGLLGSDAGTSLRTMLLRLVPTSKQAARAMNDLGITIDNTATIGAQLPSIIDQYAESLSKLNPQAQTQKLRQIFGQDAIRAATVLLGEGSQAYQNLIREQGRAGISAQLTEARQKGLVGALDSTSSVIQSLASDIGKNFLPAAEAIVRELGKIAAATDKVVTALGPLFTLVNTPIKLASSIPGLLDVAAVAGVVLAVRRRRERTQAAAAETAGPAVAASRARAEGVAAETVATEAASVGYEGLATAVVGADATAAAAVSAAAARTAALEREAAALAATTVAWATFAKTGVTSGILALPPGKGGPTVVGRSPARFIAGPGGVEEVRPADLGPLFPGGAPTAAAGAVGLAALRGRIGAGTGKLRQAISNRMAFSVNSMIAALVAETVGSALADNGGAAGAAGGVIATAGQGALIGSIFGPEGAAVGAAGAVALKELGDLQRKAKTEQASFKAKWDAMSFYEQQAILADQGAPSALDRVVDRLRFLAFTQPRGLSGVTPKEDPRFAVTRSLIAAEQQRAFGSVRPALFTLGTPRGLVRPGNIDLNRRQIARNPDGSISTERSMSITIDGREILIPTVVNGRVVSQKEAIDHYVQTHKSLGTFRTAADANAYAEALSRRQSQFYGASRAVGISPGPTQTVTPRPRALSTLADLLTNKLLPGVAPQGFASLRAALGPADKLQIQLAQAQAKDNTAAVVETLKKMLANRQRDLENLNSALEVGGGHGREIAKRIKAAQQDIAGIQGAIDQSTSDLMTKWTPRLGRLQVEQAQAALTSTAADDLAVAEKITKYYEGRLRVAEKLSRGVKDRAKKISEARLVVLQARQAEAQAQQAMVQELLSSSPALQSASIAAARAEGTQGIQDNVDAAAAVAAATQAGLEKVIALAREGKVTQQQVTEATVTAINAQNNVTQLRRQQVDSAHAGALALAQTNAEIAGFVGPAEDRYLALLRKEVATQAKIGKGTQDYASALITLRSAERQRAEQARAGALALAQLAAEESDSIGPNENRYIALLKDAVNRQAKISKGTADYAAAVSNLHTAQQGAITALQQRRQGLFDLEQARIATSLAQAGLTKTTTDNLQGLRARKSSQQRRLEQLLDDARLLETTGKKGTDRWIAAKNAVEDMRQQIIGTQGEINNLKDETGANVGSIFHEAIGAFQQFGSNIAPRGGILSPQGVRGSLGGQILERLLHSSLTEQEKQTIILAGIRDNTSKAPRQAAVLPRHQVVGSNRPPRGIDVGGGANLVEAANHGYNAN